MLFLVYVLYPIELEDISYVITLPTNAHHGPAWPTTAHSIAFKNIRMTSRNTFIKMIFQSNK